MRLSSIKRVKDIKITNWELSKVFRQTPISMFSLTFYPFMNRDSEFMANSKMNN